MNNKLTDEREAVRAAHAAWSDKAFGSVGPIGPLKHLSKEALEAAAEPGDLSEWADMQFLLWDAQRRAGITDEQITRAMMAKLAVNMARQWPEPKDGEPRFHVKSGAELQERRKAEAESKPVAAAYVVNGVIEADDFASYCGHPKFPDGKIELYATPPSPVADADPVVFTDERNLHHIARGRETSLIWGKQNQEVGDIPLYRHAQPAPVVHQIMRELVSLLDEDQFARIENIALSAGVMPPQPAPVVPDEWTIQDAVKFCRETGRQDAGSAMEAWNACRTAMQQAASSKQHQSSTGTPQG